MSRGIRILVGIAAILYVGALAAVVYTLSEQQKTDTRISQQEKFDPCVSLSEAVANKAIDRIPPLTKDCKGFLNGIGPLVTIKLSCAIIEKARYICPAPGAGHRAKLQDLGQGAVTDSPSSRAAPSVPDQKTHGRQGGGGALGGAKRPPSKKPSHPPPAGSPASPPSDGDTPPPQPGNSGDTPAAEHSQGVQACVELAASACVKTELP